MFFRRLFFLLFLPFFVQAQTLSPQAKVSVLTIGPGTDIYTFFGHTAIWITDPDAGLDRVYNYGIFDFSASGFYWNFLRGNLPYRLESSPLDYPDPRYSQMEYYKSENRSVTEQVLNFTPEQKQKLFDLLEINARPENSVYQYRPYYDNCSTRPRDKVVEAAGNTIQFDEKDVFLLGKSYRDWMNDYLTDGLWSRLGLNILLGYPIDKVTSQQESAYIPNNLLRLFDRAKIKLPNGKSAPLITETRVLFKSTPETVGFLWKSLFWLVVASPLIYVILKRNKIRPASGFDRLLLSFTGVIGVIQTLLWVGTAHGITDWNYSLFVFLPFNLIALGFLNKTPRWLLYYFLVAMVLVVVGTMLQFILWGGTFGVLFLNCTLFLRYRILAVYVQNRMK